MAKFKAGDRVYGKLYGRVGTVKQAPDTNVEPEFTYYTVLWDTEHKDYNCETITTEDLLGEVFTWRCNENYCRSWAVWE